MPLITDLVPLVTSYVTDLERENEELKSQLKEQEDGRLRVQITGSYRSHIHYEGSLKNGHIRPGSSNWNWRPWHLDIKDKNNVDVVLPLSIFRDLEVWLGDICVGCFVDVERLQRNPFHGEQFIHDDDNGSGMGRGRVFFDTGGTIMNRPIHSIYASIGPMTRADFMKMTVGSTRGDLNLEEQIASHNNLNLTMKAICFQKDIIGGSMSLLRKLGVPTSSDDSNGATGDNNDTNDDSDGRDNDDEN